MIDIKRWAWVLVFMGLWCLGPKSSLWAQKQDIIVRKDTTKKLFVDKVIKETYTEVRYKKGSSESRISADKVRKIEYYDAPEAFKNGLSFGRKGEYENAINSFKLAMEEEGVRDWIQDYCLFETAKLFQQWGLSSPEKNSDAINTFKDFLEKNPESRFYPEALFNLAKCYAANKDYSASINALDQLSQEAYDKKLGLIWEARAKFEKALTHLESGSFDDADRDFRSAGTFAAEQKKSMEEPALKQELERLENQARLYQGTVMIKKKKYNEARQFFEGISKDKASTREAKAGAECGIGECILAEGKLKEAQLQFARAKALYSDIPEEGARATFNLGVLCEELKDREPGYKRKAREYFTEVVEWYPGTDWAKKARAKIE